MGSVTARPFYWKARKCWCLHVTGKNGKRSVRKLADTRKEAFEEYEKIVAQAAAVAKSLEKKGDVAFETVAKQWSEEQVKRMQQGEVSVRWYLRVIGTLQRWNDANPGIMCSTITPAVANRWLVGKKPNYERTELGVLKQVLRWAVRSARVIQVNPLETLKLPGMTRRELTVSPEDHKTAMACHAARHIHPLLEVAYLSGCRPGELRELQWHELSDDLSQAVLHTHKTVRKTGKVRRLIFVQQAIDIIDAQKRLSDYVFLNSRKLPWTSNAVVQAVKKIREETGVKLVASAYRHTFATNALVAEVPIATVSQLLGHTSTTMVSRVYGHLSERVDHLKDAAARAVVSPKQRTA